MDELAEAMNGALSAAQRIQLRNIPDHLKCLEKIIRDRENTIDEILTPLDKTSADLLQTMPGVDEKSAKIIIGITGNDMSRFPSEDHLCAWAGVAPGNNESAGKRKQTRTTHGNKLLKSTLVVCADSVVKKKGSFFQARYRRLVSRPGHKKAIMAVAHSMLKAVWHILTAGAVFEDPGADYYESGTKKQGLIKACVKKLRTPGVDVDSAILQPV